MKKAALVLLIVAAFTSSYLAGPAASGWDCTGAETACTGTYVNYTGCYSGGNGCHSTTATTTISVNIVLDSAGTPTTHYSGGKTYTVKISASNGSGTTFPYCGFELTSIIGSASAATVANAGAWATTGLPAHTAVAPPYGHYTYLNIVEHTDTLEVVNDTFSRTFTWTAPVTGTGTISFWGAVNFVNGSTASSALTGDLWNTNHLIVNEWPEVSSVPGVNGGGLHFAAYPNPVTSDLTLDGTNLTPGNYQIEVVNAAGQIVYSQLAEFAGPGASLRVNTNNWRAGFYMVRVQKEGSISVLQVLKL